MCIPIQVLVNLETRKIKISYSFYRWVIYSDVLNKLVNIALTMMEDNIFSFGHILRQLVDIQPFLNTR